MFMEDPPEVLVFHTPGMAPEEGGVLLLKHQHRKFLLSLCHDSFYSHKQLNDRIPQRPEIHEKHCDEVTQRHLNRKERNVAVQ